MENPDDVEGDFQDQETLYNTFGIPRVNKTPRDRENSKKSWRPTVNSVVLLFFCIAAALLVFYKPHIVSYYYSSDTKGHQDTSSEDDDVSSQPNVVFILADDLGWNSLGYGSYDLNFTTPFLYKLSQEGIILSNYYAQEVCTPSRASLMTGRYPVSIGMQFNEVDPTEPWGLPLTEKLLPEALRSGGYSTYMLGKWNLGHFTPRMLPTARGFDYFLGFLTGQSYYWSKRSPNYNQFIDLMYANTECYNGYNGSDMHTYSTMFYRDKASRIIENHNYVKPLFLYVAFQAVHDPFFDYRHYTSGIPPEYLDTRMYNTVMDTVVGRKRRQYAMTLALLDEAVSSIHDALDRAGQLDNTYIIFTSDNGGCVGAGGKNGPLRGSKGNLFEGGTKVDAFIYSPLIPSEYQGTTYDGLMHVSDWFPTILNMTDVSYTPSSDRSFDGVSQLDAFYTGVSPREFMLYNYYVNVNEKNFNMYVNGPVAIRNEQYKLIHAFENYYTNWFTYDELVEDDDNLECSSCSQSDNINGNFTYFLFDLINDPFETTNLYDNDTYKSVKMDLYTELAKIKTSAAVDYATQTQSKAALVTWQSMNNYISPWMLEDDLDDGVLQVCDFNSMVSPNEPSNDDDNDNLPNF